MWILCESPIPGKNPHFPTLLNCSHSHIPRCENVRDGNTKRGIVLSGKQVIANIVVFVGKLPKMHRVLQSYLHLSKVAQFLLLFSPNSGRAPAPHVFLLCLSTIIIASFSTFPLLYNTTVPHVFCILPTSFRLYCSMCYSLHF